LVVGGFIKLRFYTMVARVCCKHVALLAVITCTLQFLSCSHSPQAERLQAPRFPIL
jgi:hypothetical protein